MDNNKFWNLLTQYLELPFDPEDVKEVDENCGTVWITLKNSETYYVDVQQCTRFDDLTLSEL